MNNNNPVRISVPVTKEFSRRVRMIAAPRNQTVAAFVRALLEEKVGTSGEGEKPTANLQQYEFIADD